MIMLTSVKGYYNGNQIVMEEDIQLSAGQEVIVTVLDTKRPQKKKINFKNIWAEGKRCFRLMHRII